MRSATVLDRAAPTSTNPHVRDLLVLWQHPETRQIIPIGRFVHDGATYAFSYTRAAGTVEGLRPLPGLPEMHGRYESTTIPLVFGQRVMESDRPDYSKYLRTLGLDATQATPWEQIVHSGGKRAGDTLQFMQVPTVVEGRVRTRFLASGVRRIPGTDRAPSGRLVSVTSEQHEEALQGLEPGSTVLVEPEVNNEKDPCAALITTQGVPLGYIPRSLSASFRELMASGPVTPRVVRVGEPGTAPHLRLVLDLDMPAPEGFVFDRDGRWEPLGI